MTIDEAIEHAEQTARSCEGGCSEDHRQLSEWLKELKRLRAVRAVQDIALANMRAANLESEQLKSENASLRGAAMGLGELCDQLKAENARYRELVEILRRDWHIEASWDGLRKFWYVGLTEEGVRERDERDAKAMEAANIEIGELRALCKSMRCALKDYHDQTYLTALDKILAENGFEMREMGIGVE